MVTLRPVERLGLLGLPNAGKSSLLNALTGARVPVAAHPFSTTETSVAVAPVPDTRLAALASMSRSRKVVGTTVEFVDIAGLVAGSSSGEGLGNRFLAGIREADAVVAVLRAFADDRVPGDCDPLADLETLELELVLADVASLEAQLPRRRKQRNPEPNAAAEVAAMEAALSHLEGGQPLYRAELNDDQRQALRSAFLLSAKPVLAVVNLGEDQLGEAERILAPVEAHLGPAAEVLAVSVQLEAEAARLDAGDRAELLDGLGLGEGAAARVLRAAHRLLGRHTFFTTGESESRAWTFRAGARAPECAGVIHSDLQRGFIRAEVVFWSELLELGSWSAARDVGKLRVEGREYPVVDGDVLEIRFNV
ncbi:MAG: redox-regulated ATPase YchF [Acidimicrobiales bacterium]